LEEIGISKINRREAVILLVKEAARRVLAGQLAPITAARQIWDLSLKLPEDDAIPELDSFIYAASEWDERPEDQHDFEAGIVEAARSLLNTSE
jgi:hypothetical protein